MMESGQKDDSKPSSLQLYEVELDDGPLSTKFWLVLNVENGKSIQQLEDWLSSMFVKCVKELSPAETFKSITSSQ